MLLNIITAVLPRILNKRKNKNSSDANSTTDSTMGLTEKANTSASSSTAEMIGKFIMRSLQLIFAVVICGLYGYRVHAQHSAGEHIASQWLYAVVVGGMSALTAIIYSLPFVKSYLAFAWDLLLFILWIAVFGTFGRIYIHLHGDETYQGTHTGRMKAAVWIDLVNVFFWLITGAYGLVKFLKARKTRTLQPGRAVV